MFTWVMTKFPSWIHVVHLPMLCKLISIMLNYANLSASISRCSSHSNKMKQWEVESNALTLKGSNSNKKALNPKGCEGNKSKAGMHLNHIFVFFANFLPASISHFPSYCLPVFPTKVRQERTSWKRVVRKKMSFCGQMDLGNTIKESWWVYHVSTQTLKYTA